MSSWASPTTFSPPVHPPTVSSALDCQDVQRSPPSVILLDAQPSRTTQLDSSLCRFPPTGTSRIVAGPRRCLVLGTRVLIRRLAPHLVGLHGALGSLPLYSTSADQVTSMQARRRQRNVTSARSDLAPETFLSSSDDFPITTSRSSGLPLS